MNKNLVIALAAGATLLTSGCATILTEKTHSVNVATSTGKSVEVQIDGKTMTVPAVVSVAKSKEDKTIVSKSADCVKETNLQSEIEPTFFINILTGGVFGSTTDYSTEQMWKYQDSVTISCKN